MWSLAPGQYRKALESWAARLRGHRVMGEGFLETIQPRNVWQLSCAQNSGCLLTILQVYRDYNKP